MIFAVINPEKLDISGVYICPPHLYTVATVPRKIQKVTFQQYYSYILQIIYVISEENKLLPPYPLHLKNVTTLPCKMLIFFHLTKGNVAFLKTLVALETAGRGLALEALKRTSCDVWQLECRASNITASVQSDHLLYGYACFQSFSPLINCIVHHALLKSSPCRNQMLP